MDFGVRTEAALTMITSYDAADCPLCRQGQIPAAKPAAVLLPDKAEPGSPIEFGFTAGCSGSHLPDFDGVGCGGSGQTIDREIEI